MNEAGKKVIEELLDRQAERLDKHIDARLQEQAERLEKRMIQVFNEGFEQVVLPHLTELNDKVDSLANKVDLLDDKVDDISLRTASIERKLDAVVERQDRQGEENQRYQEVHPNAGRRINYYSCNRVFDILPSQSRQIFS
ncbi:MAG: hypothetical protein ACYC56_08840 [Candidatus Aquicultor sp.]